MKRTIESAVGIENNKRIKSKTDDDNDEYKYALSLIGFGIIATNVC
jgi:hypothetical protein